MRRYLCFSQVELVQPELRMVVLEVKEVHLEAVLEGLEVLEEPDLELELVRKRIANCNLQYYL
jgi:hypothetical protein